MSDTTNLFEKFASDVGGGVRAESNQYIFPLDIITDTLSMELSDDISSHRKGVVDAMYQHLKRSLEDAKANGTKHITRIVNSTCDYICDKLDDSEDVSYNIQWILEDCDFILDLMINQPLRYYVMLLTFSVLNLVSQEMQGDKIDRWGMITQDYVSGLELDKPESLELAYAEECTIPVMLYLIYSNVNIKEMRFDAPELFVKTFDGLVSLFSNMMFRTKIETPISVIKNNLGTLHFD